MAPSLVTDVDRIHSFEPNLVRLLALQLLNHVSLRFMREHLLY